MKALLFFGLTFIVVLGACSKSKLNPSAYDLAGATQWQLVQKTSSAGASFLIVAPAKDSSVVLALNINKTYVSLLNNKIISQGDYSITTDTVYHRQLLQLNNFKTTGIFGLFTLVQVGTNGQVLSTFNGLYMHTSNDSLTLSGPLTPGGSTSYLFVRK